MKEDIFSDRDYDDKDMTCQCHNAPLACRHCSEAYYCDQSAIESRYRENYDNYGGYYEDMTGCCEEAPAACEHCSNYGCNAHPCN